ncbi:hypothetical protein Celal_1475 [Cellulophaga algicola DSM 14237]|uniref:Metal-dependent HD superfamily phosphohydrolase n=1 Tax=Cellulophaga algicola (strain DSM 14237 / IC166 / ACAM 630) TaxID=688270 RepID=E6XA88_CELAD|nr:hypothetical protein [Cellulophaga algicola]ADV48787.1 hypothetical protein Celal_1475 [Cellulophaga algicola DSM 14237]
MMKEKFLNLMSTYSVDEAYNVECWEEIAQNYSSNSRYYHTLDHIEHMLKELNKVETEVNNLDTLLFSIFYHDSIYSATKSDNEHRSAVLFQKRIAKTSFKNIKECMAQIEATKEHKLSENKDINILLDVDLTILGQGTETYKKYAEQIRKEYQIYPDFMYRKGRKQVLKSILELDTIYKTNVFIKEYETQARENLSTELKEL